MKDLFKTKSGRLTAYALACGYIEQHESNGVQTTLWREHGTLHVRTHDFTSQTRLAWDCPQTLTDARRAFANHKRAFARAA